MNQFANPADRIWDVPGGYSTEYRIAASKVATEAQVGLRMEVHSGHTEYYKDASTEVGQVSVYTSLRYKEWPTYTNTLKTADEHYDPADWITG